MTSPLPNPPPLQFPAHSHPRVWLITAISCPIGITLARQLLAHGDFVIGGIKSKVSERGDENFWEEVTKGPWRSKCKIVVLDERNIAHCQAAVAEAISLHGRLDILFCCRSEAVVGTIEELATSSRSLALVREQFDTNYFGPANIIRAVLPAMRKKISGHIIILTGITGHLGTPGLGVYCASGWALEGFCDSLAYEVAPFNIKMTIIQTNLEVNVLTNPITFAPLLPQYSSSQNPAPLFRTIISGILDRLEGSIDHNNDKPQPPPSLSTSSSEIVSLRPTIHPSMKGPLLAETINAIIAIGGHENPPARHIVGFEAVASVKEKLKTVSEELEDFVEVSCAVDIDDDDEDNDGDDNEDNDGYGDGGDDDNGDDDGDDDESNKRWKAEGTE